MMLRYRHFVDVDSLALNECTVHACSDGVHRWWQLWFHVARETDGQLEAFVVPIAPGGSYAEIDGRKTWGLAALGDGVWQVSPSINVTKERETHPGVWEKCGSLWHQTPKIIEVPDGVQWAVSAP
jgi:hypothetical protein